MLGLPLQGRRLMSWRLAQRAQAQEAPRRRSANHRICQKTFPWRRRHLLCLTKSQASPSTRVKSPPEVDIQVSVNPVNITADVIQATPPTMTTAESMTSVSQAPLPTMITAESTITAVRRASLPTTVASQDSLPAMVTAPEHCITTIRDSPEARSE